MKYIYSLIILAVLLLSSCVSTNFITIDVREPAVVTFDSTVVNVIVVNNSPRVSGTVLSTKPYSRKEGNQNIIVSLDSAKWAVSNSLAQFMDEEKYFGSVSHYRFNTREDDMDKDIPLTENEVAEICKKTGADALISIDRFVFGGSLSSYNEYLYTDNLLMTEIGVQARAYKSNGIKLEPDIAVIDSLFWRGKSRDNDILIPLPAYEDAVMETSVKIADKLVNYFIPSWETQNRWYYSGVGSDSNKAVQAIKTGNWSEAADIWEKSYNATDNTLTKARLASNIALAYECMDDITKSLEWVEISFDLIPQHSNTRLSELTTIYKKVLLERLKNKNKLKIQLGN